MPEGLHEITHCEVCGSRDLRRVLDLGRHPMCDDLVPIADVRVCREYPIDILFCDTCVTAHQRFQIPKQDLFPPTYHYRSRHTADVLEGMRQLVTACGERLGDLTGKKVLDIGCNDGSLLAAFARQGAVTFGIEPTGAADDAIAAGHTVLKEYLSEAVVERFVRDHGQPDIITFTNVFAHIEDLGEVIRALRRLRAPGTTLVVENHYLGAILGRNQFDTFYHEHPRTYSFISFRHIAKSLDMTVAAVEFPSRYGGNIRVFITAPSAGGVTEAQTADLETKERGYGAGLVQLSSQIERWRVAKKASLQREIDHHGRLAAKAFPGRAAIPIKLLRIDERHISLVHEKPGSAKIGHYVPGTRIPIGSDNEFSPTAQGNAPLLNLAWHISGEITAYMRSRGYQGRIIDIIAEQDFSSIP